MDSATSGTSPAASAGGDESQTGGVPSRMARKIHTKTKTGCKTCKRRKIKCDEARPSCQNCIRHNVYCDFVEASDIPTPGNANPSPEAPLSLIDLELLHNFTSSTYSTLTNEPDIRNLWKNTIIRKAVHCDYLIRTVLAVSAAHLAQHKPEKRREYISHGIVHHRIASRVAMQLMSKPLIENAENLWIFSILTMYFALGSPKNARSSLLFGENIFPDWIFLLNGVRQLFIELRSNSYSGILGPVINRGSARWLAAHEPQHENADILSELWDRITLATTDENELKVYEFAIRELRCHLSFVRSADSQTLDIVDAFVWQFSVADTFMPLLKELKPEAVVIFAYSCVILNALEGQKWLQGWGTFLLSKAWDILDDEHRLWIEWPVEEMGWVPP